jgi:hypothetical protein
MNDLRGNPAPLYETALCYLSHAYDVIHVRYVEVDEPAVRRRPGIYAVNIQE